MPSKRSRMTSPEKSQSETDRTSNRTAIFGRATRRGALWRAKHARSTSTEESQSETDGEHDRIATAKRATRGGALLLSQRARPIFTEESESGCSNGKTDRASSTTIAPNRFPGPRLAIGVSSGSTDNTADDEREERQPNLKTRRRQHPLYKSDTRTDILVEEPINQTIEAVPTNMIEVTLPQIHATEGRAGIPNEDQVQVRDRPVPMIYAVLDTNFLRSPAPHARHIRGRNRNVQQRFDLHAANVPKT